MIQTLLISALWLFATLNPYWKKYDFGGEFPVVILLSVLNLTLVLLTINKLRARRNLGDLFLLIFIIAVSASFYFSEAWGIGLSEYLAFTGLSLSYFLISALPKISKPTLYTIIKIGTLAAIAIGFYFYLTAPENRMFGPFLDIDDHTMRWPNAFALLLLLTWPIFLIRKNNTFPSFLFSLFSLSLGLSALLLTYSRGALIAFAGQIILLALFQIKYFIQKPSFLFSLFSRSLIVAALTLLIFTTANHLRQSPTIDVSDRLTFQNNEQQTSKNERQEFWQGAVQLINQNPIFGSGPFTFRYAYNPIQPSLLATSDHPHNFLLKIAVENGLIAAGAFLLFLIYLAVRTLQTIFTQRENRLEILLLSVAVAGALAHNLIDYNLNFLANALLFFLYLALLNRENQSAKPSSFSPSLLLIFSLFSFLFSLAAHLSPEKLYPRNHYLSLADTALQQQDYDQTLTLLDQHLKTNTLDAQAYYLRAVAKARTNQDPLPDLQTALTLNPKNHFIYHHDYLRAETDPAKLAAQIPQTLDLLTKYFFYVEQNIHYTAQTNNVEDAALTIDLLTEKLRNYLTAEQRQTLIEGKEKMMNNAEEWRKGALQS